jgi:RimJ/RimL family protein N-acetyltransferase
MRGKTPRLNMAEPIIVTSRLALREMTWDDLDFLATMLGDSDVMRHYPKVFTRDESATWLQRILDRYARDGHAFWLASDRVSGEPIGQVGLLNQTLDGVVEPEVGYLIHAPHWRRGYATEAAAAVRDHAFTVLDKRRVISMIRPANISSQRVALAIGSKPERMVMFHEREHILFSQQRDATRK